MTPFRTLTTVFITIFSLAASANSGAIGTIGTGPSGGGQGHIEPIDQFSVICESYDFNYNSCYVGEGVEFARISYQYSQVDCIEGYTYGVTENSVWVDQGCQAEFEVFLRSGSDGYPPPDFGDDHHPRHRQPGYGHRH